MGVVEVGAGEGAVGAVEAELLTESGLEITTFFGRLLEQVTFTYLPFVFFIYSLCASCPASTALPDPAPHMPHPPCHYPPPCRH